MQESFSLFCVSQGRSTKTCESSLCSSLPSAYSFAEEYPWWSNKDCFVKSQSSSARLFKLGKVQRFCSVLKHGVAPEALARLFKLRSELATVLGGRWFYLKGWLTHKLPLFRPKYFVNVFSKNERSKPVISGRQLTVFVASDQIQAPEWKLELGKRGHHCELDTFSVKTCLMNSVVILTSVISHIVQGNLLTFTRSV